MKTGLLALFVFLDCPTNSGAARRALTPPLKAVSTQYNPSRADNGGPTAVVCTITLSFSNASGVPQTLQVQLLDQTFSVGFPIQNRGGGFPGWDLSDPLWISVSHQRASSDRRSLTLAASGAGQLSWSPSQRGTFSASNGFGWDAFPPPVPWTQFAIATTGSCGTGVANLACGGSVSLETRAEIDVDQDRGAVLGSVLLTCSLLNSTNEDRQTMVYPLNGGRAF